jgi:hypothetical protein
MREYLSPSSDSRRWQDFQFRDGDVVISTPPKCGTTWTQMLVALLVFDGPDFPGSLTAVSPWLESDMTPLSEVNDRLARQQHRRFIKTHIPLDGLPLDDRARYVVVGRDPRDVYLSWVDHDNAWNDDRWVEMMTSILGADELERRISETPWPDTFAEAIELPAGTCTTNAHPAHVLHHLHDAWEHRGEPNVTLLHYADLSSDTPGSLARLAEELGFDTSAARCEELAVYATLSQMRGRATVVVPEADQGVWKDPAMFFAAGRMGAWSSAFSETDLTRYETRVVALYPDEEFLGWTHNGRGGGDWRHLRLTGSSAGP